MKHKINGAAGTGSNGDTKQTIVSSLPAFTALYIDTHALAAYAPVSSGGGIGHPTPPANDKQSGFVDCVYNLPPPPLSSAELIELADHFVSAADIVASLSDTTNGKAARNIPAYNFVFVDGCNSAQYISLAKAFGILQEGPDNHAMLGWKEALEDCETNRQWTKRFWQAMVDGYDVGNAIAIASYKQKPLIHENRTDLYATPLLYGDKKAKLNSAPGGFPISLPKDMDKPTPDHKDWFVPVFKP